jgi:hypothetical protein
MLSRGICAANPGKSRDFLSLRNYRPSKIAQLREKNAATEQINSFVYARRTWEWEKTERSVKFFIKGHGRRTRRAVRSAFARRSRPEKSRKQGAMSRVGRIWAEAINK